MDGVVAENSLTAEIREKDTSTDKTTVVATHVPQEHLGPVNQPDPPSAQSLGQTASISKLSDTFSSKAIPTSEGASSSIDTCHEEVPVQAKMSNTNANESNVDEHRIPVNVIEQPKCSSQ